MIAIAWRSLLARRSAVLASLVAVVLGAGLVTAALIIGGAGGSATATWRLGAADAVVVPSDQHRLVSGLSVPLPSRPALSEEQIAALRQVPGVRSVDVETPFPAYAVTAGGGVAGDADVRSWGHPWTTALADPVQLLAGTAPVGPNDVVVDKAIADAAGLSVGRDARIQTPAGVRVFHVTGLSDRPGSEFERAMFFQPDTAARLGGRPIMALVDGGSVDALRAAVPSAAVLTGAARSGALSLDLRQAELAGGGGQFVLVVSFLALTLAVFVISSTLSVSVQHRRRELAVLRTLGASPGRIRLMIVSESGLIGLFGGALGAVFGIAVGWLGIRFFVAQSLLPRNASLHVDGSALVAAVAAAVAVSLLAGWLPARRAIRVPPAESVRTAEVLPKAQSRGRTVWGMIWLLAGILSLVGVFVLGGPINSPLGTVSVSLLVLAVPLLILAAVQLGPVLLTMLLRPLEPLLSRGFGGFAASRAIRGDARRAAGVCVPLILMVMVAILLLFQDAANGQARSRVYDQQLAAELVVSGAQQLGVPAEVAAAVAHTPGVAAVSGTTGTQLIADRPSTSMAVLNATGVDPAGIAQVLKLQLLGGAWSGFRPGAIAVSQVVAQDKGWQVGQQVDFLLPDGTPQTSTVAAEFAGTLGVADVLVPSTELLPHLLEPYANAVYVKLAPGADAEAVAAQLRQAAPGTVVLTRSQHLAAVAQQSSGDNWIIDLVVVLLAGYAGIAAVNVLVGSTMARRREFALFRLGGADPAQVVRSVLVEVLFVVATAVIVGSMVGLAVIVGYGYLLTGDVWLPFLPSTYTGIVLAAVLVGVVGAVAPARVAAKSTPAQAG